MVQKRKKTNVAMLPHSPTVGGVSPEIVKISEKRLQLGIPIEALCKEAGIYRSTWQRLVAGKTQARWRTIRKLKGAIQMLEKDALQ